MSEREIWMPSDDEINAACNEDDSPNYVPGEPSFVTTAPLVRAFVRTAVERALAEEWKKNLDAKEELIRRFRELQAEQEALHKRELECPICCGSVDDSGFRCACGGSNDIRQAFEYLHGEWGRLRSELAQTEARHRREVIEARIDELDNATCTVCQGCAEGIDYWPADGSHRRQISDDGDCEGGPCNCHELSDRLHGLRAELAALDKEADRE